MLCTALPTRAPAGRSARPVAAPALRNASRGSSLSTMQAIANPSGSQVSTSFMEWTATSIVSAKMQGNIVDVLMAPLSANELCAGFAIGGLVRGLVVGLTVALTMMVFVPFEVLHFWIAIYYAVTASLLLSLLGIAGGVWAQKHEQMAVVSNFIITPLSFLSGTFYSVTQLPQPWQSLAHIDPFFYMIDGFRYAFIGHAEGSLAIGAVVMVAGNVGLWLLCRWMFQSGYRLKA